MEVKAVLLKSFGEEARGLVETYPALMGELSSQLLAVIEYKMSAETTEEKHQAQLALDALQNAAVASIKANIAEDSLKAMATSAMKFTIQIVKAAVIA